MDLLKEGIFGKGILKAVFMAGGPGSGKTFMAQNIFGIPKNASVSVSGLQVVNSHKQIEQFGISKDLVAFLSNFSY